MHPSPHSTDRSSRENLVDLLVTPIDDDDSAALISIPKDNEGKTKTCSASGYANPRLVVAVVGIAVALFSLLGARHESWKIPLPTDSSQDDASSISQKKGKLPALSTLDPVHDLKLYSYKRPDSSKPPKVLSKSAAQVYPTNAWYQNLLMVEDVPTDLHRVYAIPYIVDAAGRIAGIRLHAGQRTASNTVIQWNVQNEFGLTIGNLDAASRFELEATTPLGLTLGWVSQTEPIVKLKNSRVPE